MDTLFATSPPRGAGGSTPAWFIDWALEGQGTASGQSITGEKALTASAVFACIRNLSEDVAKLPLILYRRLPDGGKERAAGEKLYTLLHDSPNPEMTAFSFRQAVTGQALLRGAGYAEIEWSNDGRTPLALWPLDTRYVGPARDPSTRRLIYKTRPMGTEKPRMIPAENILAVPGFSTDGIVGRMIASLGRESVGLALAIERFGALYFGNGLQASCFLEHPGALSPLARDNLRASLKTEIGGDARWSVKILEEGMKFNKASSSNAEEAQFLETRQFQVEEVARWFRLPPHKIQQLLHATFGNIEHQALEYVIDTLMPWFVKWEQEISRRLIAPTRQRELFAEHLVDALLRGDAPSRSTALATQFANGALTQDEWRAIENRNPLPDGLGKKFYVPQQLAPVDANPQDKPPAGGAAPRRVLPAPPPDEEPGEQADESSRLASAFAPVFAAATERVLAKERMATDRQLARGPLGREWLETFHKGQEDYLAELLYPPGTALANLLAGPQGDPVDAQQIKTRISVVSTVFGSRAVAWWTSGKPPEEIHADRQTGEPLRVAGDCIRSLLGKKIHAPSE